MAKKYKFYQVYNHYIRVSNNGEFELQIEGGNPLEPGKYAKMRPVKTRLKVREIVDKSDRLQIAYPEQPWEHMYFSFCEMIIRIADPDVGEGVTRSYRQGTLFYGCEKMFEALKQALLNSDEEFRGELRGCGTGWEGDHAIRKACRRVKGIEIISDPSLLTQNEGTSDF